MLMAHPAVLSRLISEYEALSRLVVRSADTKRRMDDLAYTLCVSTGTRDIDTALVTARHFPGRVQPRTTAKGV